MRVLALFLVALVVTAASINPCRSDTIRIPPLSEIIKKGSILARVRIVDGHLLKYEERGVNKICGLALKAQILESVVGPEQSFWFIARPRDYYVEADEQLVLAVPYSVAESDRPLKADASADEIARTRCLSQVAYTSALPVRALVPFVRVPATSDHLWVYQTEVSVAMITGVHVRLVEDEYGSQTPLLPWPDVRAAFRRAAPH